MKTIRILVHSLDDTEKLGDLLGRAAVGGEIICLDGDLGAGKTALTQAIARSLGVPPDCYVTSPSFALLHEYPGRLKVFHMDFYRLQDESEVEDLGLEEYFYLGGVSIIEWSKRAAGLLPAERLDLDITVTGNTSRSIRISGAERYRRLMGQLEREFAGAQ